ncbi:MAG TPA: hypothetical protein VEQ38_07775 [Verrucomicrobiae bacterium]|nr:hypothetical protein [Verrucomicrobiae bacterium]
MLRRKPDRDKSTPVKAEESPAGPQIKFAKPKILLIDLDDDVEKTLQAEGYNVTSGTFGAPYQVGKGSHYEPVVIKASLPNYTEQELFVIDLEAPKTLPAAPADKVTPMEELDWWAKCSHGEIDPRPRTMRMVHERLDLILNNGGAFVIFAEPRDRQNLVLAQRFSHNFHVERELHWDNWSFLSAASSIAIDSDYGTEVTVTHPEWPLGRLLQEHIGNATFKCTLEPSYDIKERWVTLATNKYGATVAACIAPPEKSKKGWIFIFPRLQDKAGFLAAFFKAILPDLAPALFPEAEGRKWVHRVEYELPSVMQKVQSISAVENDAAEKVRELEAAIASERATNQFLYDLLLETGEKLVAAVKTSLDVLGFKDVVDVDEEMKAAGKDFSLREDLRIHDESPALVVDVKGIAGKPADAEALQAQKHAFIYIQENNRADVRGLTIINHQRMLPPLDRDNDMPFRKEILDNALQLNLGLITTWDLFRLLRGVNAHKWPLKYVKPLFYQTGRIFPVPKQYRFVGKTKHVWKHAFSVVIEDAELHKNDRIAIDLHVDFDEQIVESLQINDAEVESAVIGSEVGIGRSDTTRLKPGLNIYRVTEPDPSST